MKFVLLSIILLATLAIGAGCSYWPQTFQADYYKDGAREVKEDFDDVSGARTL